MSVGCASNKDHDQTQGQQVMKGQGSLYGTPGHPCCHGNQV